jgi:HSP20 family molecular chaperone IbpA
MMDAAKRRTTMVGIVTAIVGLVVGLGIGVWGIKTSNASNPPTATSHTRSSATASNYTNANTARTNSSSTMDQNKDEDSWLSPKDWDHWDPFRDMERMQEQIDRAIHDATEKFSFGQGATAFPPVAGYSSSFDLRDRKDHYELRAYLPDVNPANVNVKIDNDRMLHVSVKQQRQQTKNTNNGSASISELGQYEQVVTLPEPVRSQDMKIDRHGHEIVITIPKANPSSNSTT